MPGGGLNVNTDAGGAVRYTVFRDDYAVATVTGTSAKLPAVVGTGDATARIADGRTVELDGSSGYVHLR